MSDGFHIHQALFGYRRGHQLLVASVDLAPRVRQFLATVTDGSGPEMPDNAEGAYTGLPVPETHFYALFCTWPAPEMPRPGCVWTHVLLIDVADLARIPDLGLLRACCARPEGSDREREYEEPIAFDARRRLQLGRTDRRRAECLVANLYGAPGSELVLLDDGRAEWESVVFAVWSQQWPKMRRAFAFSTESFGDRRMAGVSFDVQVAPKSTERLWRRGKSDTRVVDYAHYSGAPTRSAWVDIAIDELSSAGGRGLRDFLCAYGSDVKGTRSAFAKLVECYALLNNDDEGDVAWGERLAAVASAFPDAGDAITLKREWLTSRVEDSRGLEATWAATYFLLNAPVSSAFERVPWDFRQYAAVLWREKRADATALLGAAPSGERSTAFVDAIASEVQPEDVPALWREHADAAARLVFRAPRLVTKAAAWNLPYGGQRKMWDLVRSASADERLWAQICAAMLEAQCAFSEHETVSLAGSSLPEGLGMWLAGSGVRLPSGAWRDALRAPLEDAMRSGALPAPLLALTAWVLTPESARAVSGRRQDVQELASGALSEIPAALLVPTQFWMTAIGLQTAGDQGLKLLASSFFPVYDAVLRSHYPGDAWALLSPLLPEVPRWLDWDRCRRLRRALRNWVKRNPELKGAIVAAAPSPEQARILLK